MSEHKYDPIEKPSERFPAGSCKTCGLPESAHGDLAPHPDERRLRSVEVSAATTLSMLARKASRALREHRRVDAVVLLTQLEVTVDNLRKGMVVAIDDQMKATRETDIEIP